MQFLSAYTFSPIKLVENRVTLTVVFFLALSAIALSIGQGVSYFKSKRDRGQLIQNVIDNGLRDLQQRAASKLTGNIVALNVIASSPTLHEFIHEEKKFSKRLENLLAAALHSNPNAFQIRYISGKGDEIIRLEKTNGKITRVGDEKLQNKTSRKYFIEAMQLEKGRVYVSDIALNIEHGVVQIPWMPTIRLAVPVFGSGDQPNGIVIVNVNAESFINIYSASNVTARVDIMLANTDGYWLYGRPEESLWGFILNHQQKVATIFPETWDKINNEKGQIFRADGSRWTVQPTRVSDLLPDFLQYSAPDKILWYALVRNPPQSIAMNLASFVPTFALLLVVIAFSWAWATSVIDRRRTEKELVKSEKMSSLGGLVAGVAHELNTPIGSAVTIASTMQDQAGELWQEMERGQIRKSRIVDFVSDVNEASAIILRGLNRANELIAHFKQIAVDQSGEQRRKFILDDYIQEMTATFFHLFKHRNVKLQLDLNSGATLDSFPGALSQVVINLVQNALLHGFAASDTGIVRIVTRREGDSQVELEVYDNGAGIPAAIIGRIFEPFFTTKLGQGGSGLGLHIVYNIVTGALGGKLEVTSDREERSTRFIISLPSTAVYPNSKSEVNINYAQRTAA